MFGLFWYFIEVLLGMLTTTLCVLAKLIKNLKCHGLVLGLLPFGVFRIGIWCVPNCSCCKSDTCFAFIEESLLVLFSLQLCKSLAPQNFFFLLIKFYWSFALLLQNSTFCLEPVPIEISLWMVLGEPAFASMTTAMN